MGYWAMVGHYFGSLGWVRKYFGWVGVVGGEWGWVHCLIMPVNNTLQNFATAWEKRDRFVVFNTILVSFFCELVRHLLFSILMGKCIASDKI